MKSYFSQQKSTYNKGHVLICNLDIYVTEDQNILGLDILKCELPTLQITFSSSHSPRF